MRFATTTGLAVRAKSISQILEGFKWLGKDANPEWSQLYMYNIIDGARQTGQIGTIATALRDEPRMREFLSDVRQLDLAA